MSYQVIARKWRPNTFEEVTGQEAITRTLRNGIEHDRLHHAYLFSGARGVGKTTTARLLAKALNCHKTPKPNPRPCSPLDAEPMCASCQEIAEGRSIDVLEIDAASNTGVDNVREVIINNLGIAPARDRFKVFIIDEVHMLSTSSFNALLKSIEEPPPQVVFIMATTELHKVPDTILSRCQEFEFRTIPAAKIFERLKLIADAEKINVTDEALREIARAGEGSMRDAQSAFDQVISFSGETIEIENVTTALGIASAEMLSKTIEAIAEKNALQALQIVEELTSRGQDLRNFCRDLLSHLRDLLVAKISGDAADGLLDSAILSDAEIKAQTQNFSEADLIRFFNSLSETESSLRQATQPRYVLEIGLVKLIEMRRVVAIEQLLERLGQFENLVGDGTVAAIPTSDVANRKSDEPRSAAMPTAEKKTLKVDFPLSEVPFPVKTELNQPVVMSNGESSAGVKTALEKTVSEIAPETVKEVQSDSTKFSQSVRSAEPANFASPEFLDTITVKLPPITSEDLEHFDDHKLDDAYEELLQREGDDLKIIPNISNFVRRILELSGLPAENGNVSNSPTDKSNVISITRGASKSQASIIDPSMFEPEDISDEIPELPENPTAEDLWRFAENHPKVKMAMRIFRAKIISVTDERASEKS